jgi:hypothetical protein
LNIEILQEKLMNWRIWWYGCVLCVVHNRISLRTPVIKMVNKWSLGRHRTNWGVQNRDGDEWAHIQVDCLGENWDRWGSLENSRM